MQLKNISKIVIALISILAVSCNADDVDNRPVLESVSAPEMTLPVTGKTFVLTENNADNKADLFKWNPATYSHDVVVSYSLLMDVKGGDFTNAIELGGTAGATQIEVSVKTLNDAVLALEGITGEIGSYDVKVMSHLSGIDTMISANPLTILINAYQPAVANNCPSQFAVGAGIPSAGWGWDTPLTLICNDDVLVATTSLINDTFRFFTVNADWGTGRNYPWYVSEGYKISSSLTNALDGDSNFRFTGTPGVYRIKVDGVNKTITVAQGETSASSYWLVGEATPGGWTWENNSETELPLISDGIYEIPVVLNKDKAFRVFLGNNGTNDGNWDASKNYLAFANDGYTITPELVNAEDGDQNFKYTGATGLRVLKINTIAKTITLD